jgi:7-cyano-7-deazaguanine synthase
MDRVAVLASGGLDSCVLVADLARTAEVTPVHVSMGLAWEEAEIAALERFLERVAQPNIRPLVRLSMPVQSVYGQHWSITGTGIPAADAPDRDVYLPGRNVLLLSLVGIWCSLQGIHTMAIGSLSLNPFPDGTPEFFEKFSAAVGMGLGHELLVLAPYRGRSKADLIREFRDLPLELTLTCMNPVSGQPCGRCNKCEERRAAFEAAGL